MRIRLRQLKRFRNYGAESKSDQIATLKEHVEITKYKKGEMIYQCDENSH